MKSIFFGLLMLGYAWCVAVMLLVVAYALVVWVQDGFGTMLRLCSPFHNWNWLTAIAMLAPGIVLIIVGDRLWNRANMPDRE